MPIHQFACPQCSGCWELATGPQTRVTPCPQCGIPLSRQPNLRAAVYLADRDRAVNSGQNARYRDWLRSPEVQRKIQGGELQPERPTNTHPLSDHLDCMQPPDLPPDPKPA